ncbi:MAG: chromosome segregation protein SMC [Thermoplasmata archaeon]|nr:chromosome segregation protein SMC [Thermoplasmata archaeon]
MYLREIQIENFKSFGNRVRIPFLTGFTAITGPNGSGKSNIIDAILFVLGVRSPKMVRAERLTDLIHKGAKDANYCKVSLIFDNSSRELPVDSDEIILTRKIKKAPLPNKPDNYYSYYYINGKSASLSEFIGLLSEGNISENCIVQQGDVTAIVEMSDMQRRKIIDELAGISDFDTEIEKAKKEREEVEDNMEKIEIILSEIRKQIRQLKRDRDDALRYKELKDGLSRYNAMMSYKKKVEIEREIAEVTKQIESYEKSKAEYEERIKEIKKKYNEKVLRFQELEDKIASIGGEELIEIKQRIDAAKEEIIKSKERINHYRMEIAEGEGEIKELESRLSKVKKELKQYERRIKELNEEYERKDRDAISIKSKLEEMKRKAEHSDEIAMELSREIAKLRKILNEKREEHHKLLLERDRISQQMEGIEARFMDVKQNKESLETELQEVKEELAEKRKGTKEQEKRKEELEKKLFDFKKREAEIGARLRELDRKIISIQRELAKLRNQQDMASISSAVRAILDARDEGIIKGIHGSIAELGEVDEEYSLALEIAAGRRIESIVVENDEVAAKCIEYLKKNDYGRATFLPLNKLSEGKPRGKALLASRDKDAIGFAIDLVKFNPRYRAAFWYVFGDTIVVRDIDAARRLMGGVRLVTLQGELIEASGAMTGGSVSRRGSFGVADRKRINELAEELRKASSEQELLTDELVKVKEDIGKIEEELGSISFKGMEDIEKLEIRRKEIERSLKVAVEEYNKIERERDELRKKLDEIVLKIDAAEKRIEEIEEKIKSKEEELIKIANKEAIKEINEMREKLNSLQEELISIDGEIKTNEKQVEVIEERKKEIEERIEELKNKIKEMKEEISMEQKNVDRNKHELKTMETIEAKISGKATQMTKERDKLYREITEMENKIENLSTKIETTIDLIARAKARLPTLESALAEVMDIEMEFDEKELLPMEEIKRKIKEIETKMEKMQPINMRALEEYERQEERKNKFEEEINRLKQHRKELIKLEGEINQRKKEAFFEVFNKVRENYRKIYSQLTGGEGDLILENEENPFEGGLIIKVKPPGKRSLSLKSLSGGEKSIASLSFIFAIQEYEPSSFYALDEIDMFLDEKNAEKVAKMISENSRKAQFIVVSLRRITLMQADHIYGVTSSNGVSTIIGNVNVREVEKMVEVK